MSEKPRFYSHPSGALVIREAGEIIDPTLSSPHLIELRHAMIPDDLARGLPLDNEDDPGVDHKQEDV